MPSTSTDLDALWAYCEHEGRITPALVDYTRESGNDAYADFLDWCRLANRWPVGGTSIQFRWGNVIAANRPYDIWIRSHLPIPIVANVERTRRKASGKRIFFNLSYALFPTAREAFECIYHGWQKLTELERRELE